MSDTTFRALLRAGCKSVLDAYKAANPTQLVHTYNHRPASFRTPCAFVDNVMLEPSITVGASIRRRELVARIVVVNKVVSNEQAAGEQDALVDGLVEAFSDKANARAASAGAYLVPVSVDADSVTDGDATYAASVINVTGVERTGDT